jgi:hypothetical protein
MILCWTKECGSLSPLQLSCTVEMHAVFGLPVIAYNLIRLGNLLRPMAMEAA